MTHAIYILLICLTAFGWRQIGYDEGLADANGVCKITCEVRK